MLYPLFAIINIRIYPTKIKLILSVYIIYRQEKLGDIYFLYWWDVLLSDKFFWVIFFVARHQLNKTTNIFTYFIFCVKFNWHLGLQLSNLDFCLCGSVSVFKNTWLCLFGILIDNKCFLIWITRNGLYFWRSIHIICRVLMC